MYYEIPCVGRVLCKFSIGLNSPFLSKYPIWLKTYGRSRVTVIFANCHIFWHRRCLGQCKIAFDNSFGQILSSFMFIQAFIIIYHVFKDLRRFLYFHIFWPRRYLGRWKVAFDKSVGQTLKVCQTLSKYSQRFKRYGHFR